MEREKLLQDRTKKDKSTPVPLVLKYSKLRSDIDIYITFLLHALRYWSEILHMTLFVLMYYRSSSCVITLHLSGSLCVHTFSRRASYMHWQLSWNLKFDFGFFKGFVWFTVCICWQVCRGLIRRWNNDILYIKLTVPLYRIWTQQRIN